MSATYEATTAPKDGAVVEGDMRQIVKIVLLRYDTPNGQPVKCGTREVRAWTRRGMTRAVQHAVDELVNRDRRKRREEITSRIERLTSQQS